MSARIFVNLPVKGLQRSVRFFSGPGLRFEPRFTDDTATCMIVGQESFVMLLTDAPEAMAESA